MRLSFSVLTKSELLSRLLKLNIQSPTSPYRHRYKSLPTDGNSDMMPLDIIDDDGNLLLINDNLIKQLVLSLVDKKK